MNNFNGIQTMKFNKQQTDDMAVKQQFNNHKSIPALLRIVLCMKTYIYTPVKINKTVF